MHYTKRGSLDQSLSGTSGTARLAPGGVLVMAAGALVTPRLLLLSGVGPQGREARSFPVNRRPHLRSTMQGSASASSTMS